MEEHISSEANQRKTLGEKLRDAREQQSLSLEDVAKQLNIRRDWLCSLEQDQYDFTAPAYLKGYLRGYSKLLNIYEDIQEWPEFEARSINTNYLPLAYKKQFSTANKSIRWMTYAIIFLLILLVVKWWNADVLSSGNVTSLNNDDPIIQLQQPVLSSQSSDIPTNTQQT